MRVCGHKTVSRGFVRAGVRPATYFKASEVCVCLCSAPMIGVLCEWGEERETRVHCG